MAITSLNFGPLITGLYCFGLFLGTIYSVPPLRLKRSAVAAFMIIATGERGAGAGEQGRKCGKCCCGQARPVAAELGRPASARLKLGLPLCLRSPTPQPPS